MPITGFVSLNTSLNVIKVYVFIFFVLWVSVCIEGNTAEFMSEQEIMFQKGMILLSDVT